MTRSGSMTFALALACAIIAVIGRIAGLYVNLTPSLPRGLYRATSAPPTRGRVVLACLPSDMARLARQRGYIAGGSCPERAMPIGKVVQGVPGDTVVVTRAGTWINHAYMPGSRPLDHDRAGRPLPQLTPARYVLPPHTLWLDTPHPLSFGSRYTGPLSDTLVVTVLTPLLVATSPLVPATSHRATP